ncbi:MAG: (2Fe-2S) ferredoxin domain-containing protein [Spirochaetales bacterium]|nr:(2Fe-2S) ferredoxin domain-containing protein [Spirochaetales bacterium]
MAKMTLEELRKLRAGEKQALSNRETEGKEIQVIIGMGTCGIAAGAKDTMNAFVDTINSNGIKNVTVRQTGCMGLCYAEPTVEIKMAGMADTVYGNVDAATAKEIVENHIMHKRLVDNHIFDKPAADITQ